MKKRRCFLGWMLVILVTSLRRASTRDSLDLTLTTCKGGGTRTKRVRTIDG